MLPVVPVVQGAIAGTAQAVESARPFIDGPFGVANADDLYGAAALVTLADHPRDGTPGDHVLVGYHLKDTVITDEAVTRGLCEIGGDGYLSRIVENRVLRVAGATGRERPVGPQVPDPRSDAGEEHK